MNMDGSGGTMRYVTFSHLSRPLEILYKHKIIRKNKPMLEGLSLFQQKALSPGLDPTLNMTKGVIFAN